VPKDKSGKQLTWKEFMARWKQGILKITPHQQSKITYKNTYIMLFGVLAGFVSTLFFLKTLWWLSIILLAAFVNTIILQIGNYQKYQLLKSIETMKREVENE